MAIPPEPIDELIAQAQAIVVARVIAIIATGPLPTQPVKVHPGDVGVGIKRPSQKVKLGVERVLKGPTATEIVVDKPEGAYTVALGETGAFFLSGGRIIGRYGPATHSLARIEAALTPGN